jgi:hypothetical protein
MQLFGLYKDYETVSVHPVKLEIRLGRISLFMSWPISPVGIHND